MEKATESSKSEKKRYEEAKEEADNKAFEAEEQGPHTIETNLA